MVDFRKIYSLSVYDAGETYMYEEGWDLIKGLAKDTTSMLWSAMAKRPAHSTTDQMLQAIQWTIVESIPVAKNQAAAKQRMKIKPFEAIKEKPKPTTRTEAEKKFAVFGKATRG